ncbi:MAG: hypothetical protein IID18_08105 [Nitrospinae bacterium]|nr:hypothetical protein [Nitrospinota bacterium]
MKTILMILTTLFLISFSASAFAAEVLKFPMREGSNAGAHEHNQEGIMHYGKGHFKEALKHFQMASKIDSSVGESHYNEALCLDKLGQHGDATKHFYAARKYAHGNSAILKSPILNDHAPMKSEGS